MPRDAARRRDSRAPIMGTKSPDASHRIHRSLSRGAGRIAVSRGPMESGKGNGKGSKGKQASKAKQAKQASKQAIFCKRDIEPWVFSTNSRGRFSLALIGSRADASSTAAPLVHTRGLLHSHQQFPWRSSPQAMASLRSAQLSDLRGCLLARHCQKTNVANLLTFNLDSFSFSNF